MVRALVLGAAERQAGETPVVHLTGARITGRLRLEFAEACCVLRLERCWFERKPQLYGASLRVTGFAGSHLPGFSANRVLVAGGNLDLMHTRITAPGLSVYDTRIDGGLLLQGAHLSNPGAVALHGSRLDLGGGLVGDEGFRIEGELQLPEARLGEGLRLRGAQLSNPGATALTCRNLQTRVLDLRATRVVGTLDLRHTHLDVLHLP
ncbi:oxidoreductase, partial [Streptomyces hainanensis]